MRNSLTGNNRTSVNVCILNELFTDKFRVVELFGLNSNAIYVPRKTITRASSERAIHIYSQ